MRVEKTLVIDDAYGKLEHSKFFVLHFAPPADLINRDGKMRLKVMISDFKDTIFVIKQNDAIYFAKLTGWERMLLHEVPEGCFWADRGCSKKEWVDYFKSRYPQLNDYTPLAFYVYERVLLT